MIDPVVPNFPNWEIRHLCSAFIFCRGPHNKLFSLSNCNALETCRDGEIMISDFELAK